MERYVRLRYPGEYWSWFETLSWPEQIIYGDNSFSQMVRHINDAGLKPFSSHPGNNPQERLAAYYALHSQHSFNTYMSPWTILDKLESNGAEFYRELAEEIMEFQRAIELASKEGYCSINSNPFLILWTQRAILAEQKLAPSESNLRKIDLSIAPFWLTPSRYASPQPIYLHSHDIFLELTTKKETSDEGNMKNAAERINKCCMELAAKMAAEYALINAEGYSEEDRIASGYRILIELANSGAKFSQIDAFDQMQISPILRQEK
ncbi:hypothetical protein KUW04_16455 [Halomonas denitrificans]|nr:hypothetical protein [Halomonas denitrificans]